MWNDKRTTVLEAWGEALDRRAAFLLVVSIPHGAILPAGFVGVANLRVGPGLTPPVELAMDDQGIAARLSFEGRPFDARVPWGALACVASDWKITQWPLGELAPPKPGAHLRRIK